ncbi:NAD(P)-dependent oxidoreductase [Spirosoma flavum]|uniref:NAD(P)-dependent oxidoreductase n=1 Tax=Spirosoma flavum TaxID=2048557 RepID=A0ABW6AJB8_9BACT
MTINLNSTIAILGGAGKAGRPLVQQALKAGYRVRLLLRYPEQFDLTDDRMEIIQGDARNPTSIRQLLQGCEALISTLGNPRGEGIAMLSSVTRLILLTMQEFGISRYVVVSSYYGIGQEQQDAKTKQAAEFMQQHFPLFMDDRKVECQLLTESDLDWTYVRLPYLVQEPATRNIKVESAYLPGQQITVEDLAGFLLNQLDNRHYIRQALFIANGTGV